MRHQPDPQPQPRAEPTQLDPGPFLGILCYELLVRSIHCYAPLTQQKQTSTEVDTSNG